MFAIVINQDNYKVEFVVLNQDNSPQFYELKEGERLIKTDWQIANSMNKPQWNGIEWIDTDPLPPIEPQEPLPDQNVILEEKVNNLEATTATLLMEVALLKSV